MSNRGYIDIAVELDKAGLVWHPEIGDEVIERTEDARVSILVDPQGLTPAQLREAYIWLPTVEQLVEEIESRQAQIFHAGVTASSRYEAVIKTACGMIEARASNLRGVFGEALKRLLCNSLSAALH